jgi:hypothetical protein
VQRSIFGRATSADPGYVDAHANLAMVLVMRGQFDEALRELVVARQLDSILFDLHPMEGLLQQSTFRPLAPKADFPVVHLSKVV